MKTTRQRFTTRGRLLIVVLAAVLAGLTVAVPLSMADGAAAPAPVRPAVPAAATPSSGCHVTWDVKDWPGQFEAKVTFTNTGTTPIKGWKLSFTFPGDQAVSSAWNATFTQVGHEVTATNQDYYDAVIQPRATRSIGFLGAWQSDNTAPTDFRVNAITCH